MLLKNQNIGTKVKQWLKTSHSHIHAYTQSCINTYIHAYMHSYIYTNGVYLNAPSFTNHQSTWLAWFVFVLLGEVTTVITSKNLQLREPGDIVNNVPLTNNTFCFWYPRHPQIRKFQGKSMICLKCFWVLYNLQFDLGIEETGDSVSIRV